MAKQELDQWLQGKPGVVMTYVADYFTVQFRHHRWHILPTEVVVVATRNVVLSQHQHELVEALVESGRYQNASEVLREGLRLLERRETEDAAKLTALRQAVEKGWSDLAAGRFDDVADQDLDDFIGQLGSRAGKTQPGR